MNYTHQVKSIKITIKSTLILLFWIIDQTTNPYSKKSQQPSISILNASHIQQSNIPDNILFTNFSSIFYWLPESLKKIHAHRISIFFFKSVDSKSDWYLTNRIQQHEIKFMALLKLSFLLFYDSWLLTKCVYHSARTEEWERHRNWRNLFC